MVYFGTYLHTWLDTHVLNNTMAVMLW